MTWTYQNQIFIEAPDDHVGFVYIITNTKTRKRYIGKKNFWSSKISVKTVIVKSTGLKKKKKTRIKIPSDWMEYYGSSDALKADVELLGTDIFSREIIRLCKTAGELSYFESKYQFEYDVLLNPDDFYNSWVMCRVHRKHLTKLLPNPKSVL